MKYLVPCVVVLFVSHAALASIIPNGGFEEWSEGDPAGWAGSTYTSSGYPAQTSDAAAGEWAGEWQWDQQDNGLNIPLMARSDMFQLTTGEEYTLTASFKPLAFTSTGIGEVEMLLGVVGTASGDFVRWVNDDENQTLKLMMWYGHNASEPAVGDGYVTRTATFVAPSISEVESYRVFMLNRYWRGAKIALDDVDIVPEPATGLLLVAGTAVVVCRRRRNS